MMLSV